MHSKRCMACKACPRGLVVSGWRKTYPCDGTVGRLSDWSVGGLSARRREVSPHHRTPRGVRAVAEATYRGMRAAVRCVFRESSRFWQRVRLCSCAPECQCVACDGRVRVVRGRCMLHTGVRTVRSVAGSLRGCLAFGTAGLPDRVFGVDGFSKRPLLFLLCLCALSLYVSMRAPSHPPCTNTRGLDACAIAMRRKYRV